MSSNKKFLVILNSVNEDGQSTFLAKNAKEYLEQKGWSGSVLDLNKNAPEHLNTAAVKEFFSKDESSGVYNQKSNEYIKQLFDVELIVVAAPMYNFSISSTLKSWIDYIARAGKTFSYTAQGPVGHLKHLKALILQTSGGDYTSEQMLPWEHVNSYLNIVFGFMGISKINTVRLGGVASDGLDNRKENALKEIKEYVSSL